MRDSVTGLLITTMEARQLLGAGSPLGKNHVRALQTMCTYAESKMKPESPIIYRGSPELGYIVCTTRFNNLDGAGYVHKILMQATNQVESSRRIPAVELETWGAIGKSGEYLSPTEPGVFLNEDIDIADVSFQGGSRDPEYSRDELAIFKIERDRLIEAGEKPESSPLLDFYIKRLNESRYLGNKKVFIEMPVGEDGKKREPKNDPESARKRVQQSIDYFIQQLLETEDTRHLGLHFMDAIDTGLDCEYVGEWPFKLF